jgi:hypothetical protein
MPTITTLPFNFARHRAVSCALALALAACTGPSSSTAAKESPGGSNLSARRDGPARLSFGATSAQALDGRTSSFALSATPDLVLHATCDDDKYDGKTLLVKGVDPRGQVAWSYPHLQKGRSCDAILPVFGSPAARARTTGLFRFTVAAPDHTIVAEGEATLTSTTPDGGPA